MTRFSEQAPTDASIIYGPKYIWSDDERIAKRGKSLPYEESTGIYGVHPGGWRRGKNYLDLTEKLVSYAKWQGYVHVESTPLAEYPFEPSWSYQTTGYYSPTSHFGEPNNLRFLIGKLRQAGTGMILDWVPEHLPKDDWVLDRFDGTALCEHTGPRQGGHMDWGTYIFNYDRNKVKSFLISDALYWLSEFHIDDLRVDAVASMLHLDYSRVEGQWVPNKYKGRESLGAIDFLRYVSQHMHKRHPEAMMIAEESASFPGATRPVGKNGLSSGFKWNMGWANDTLRYLALGPVYRQYKHSLLTFAVVYQYSENLILSISYDEVVHGKDSTINKVSQGDWHKFAILRAFYSFVWNFPGRQLVLMDSEFTRRLEFNGVTSLEWWVTELWGHGGLQRLFRDFNMIYRDNPPLLGLGSAPKGLTWINANNRGHNTLSQVRNDPRGSHVACFTSSSPEPLRDYPTGLPSDGEWEEIPNMDLETYDGSGQFGNLDVVIAHDEPWRHFLADAEVAIPPLGLIWLRHKAK